MLFNDGDFLILTDGTNKIIGNKEGGEFITNDTAMTLYKEGKIDKVNVWMKGDEVSLPVEQYIRYRNQI